MVSKNELRVFVDGTAFFVMPDGLNPFDLMARRGNEVHFVMELDDVPRDERELRQIVMSDDMCNEHYLNQLFDTPAEGASYVRVAC